jgi:ABC-type glycerol-3-phosphate transport system substrate-binding protein
VRKRYALFAALMLVSALVLSACGGGGDSSGDSAAEGEIESAIENSATEANPDNCTKLETLAFVEQNSGEKGTAAVVNCEEEAEDSTGKADSVKVTNIEIDGSKATADAALSGGSLDGQTVTIALVKEGGWKLDQINGFAKLDVGGIVEALRGQLEESGSLTEEQTDCIVTVIEEADESDLEELVLNGTAPKIEADTAACE